MRKMRIFKKKSTASGSKAKGKIETFFSQFCFFKGTIMFIIKIKIEKKKEITSRYDCITVKL